MKKVINGFKEEFKKREGFGVCGYSLATITKRLAELCANEEVCINVPYNNFACKGTANKVAKDVDGLMPFSKNRIDANSVTTLYYGNKLANKNGYYFPFQGECNVFFVSNVSVIGKVIVIDLVNAPNWRMYI